MVVLFCWCSLEQCLDPVFWTSIKTCNFVTFYECLIHLGVYHTSSNKAELYEFLARYVRKVYPDTDIKKDLKNKEGFLFIDRITPSTK